MTENLLAVTGASCVIGAVAGLASPLWALLLAGVLIVLAAYALHTQAEATPVVPAEDVNARIEEALSEQQKRHEIDVESAVSIAIAGSIADLETMERRLAAAQEQPVRLVS